MEQYMAIKEEYQDSIIFYRLGDFYEMFFDDALTASRELEITLTQRDCGMEEKAPMCGVPHHVADVYVSRLVKKGYKVAICDQLEDAAEAKGIVKRGVVRVVTPGTITDPNVLDEKSNNFLVSVYFDELGVGISYVDNSTGEMYTSQYIGNREENYKFIIDELGKIAPTEIICNEEFLLGKKYIKIIENKVNPFFNVYKDIESIENDMEKSILNLFKSLSLKDLDLDKKIYAIISTHKLINYLYTTQKNTLDHINNLVYYKAEDYMIIDINTRTNLEIHETIMSKDKKGALVNIIDHTSTAMGGRLLKIWLEQPLIHVEDINKRLNIVDYFFQNIDVLDEVKGYLRKIYDMERLSSKISNGNCNARDLISLKNSLEILPSLKELLTKTKHREIENIGRSIDTLEDIFEKIQTSIVDDPPISITDGGIIKFGYDEDLDIIKDGSIKGKQWLSNLEAREREESGIKNLKIGFNKIIGYYFEITKSNISMAPDHFTRRQTLANSERYFTDELKDMESKIVGANEKAKEMEYNIFQKIRQNVKDEIIRIQYTSRLVSKIDVLVSFAFIAIKNNYTRPKLNTKGSLEIIEGRHPVVENTIESNLFIPNDSFLDLKNNMIQIITGPNMAGKSTYMRQVALINLLAQTGSFVPAKSANISIVDRIFTRIGASDNLSQGESTFMVEMNEVANIVNNATVDSLIILDEVGRGTSTYDGLSIAWAVVEHIVKNIGAKTLFATHYHELTQLESQYKGIKNMTIVAEEKGEDIIFLRKVIEGSTNKSYGIQVAKLAGINKDIRNRAYEILLNIEGSHKIDMNKKDETISQISLLDYKKDYFLDKIIDINIDSLTPIETMTILNSLIDDAKKLKENKYV